MDLQAVQKLAQQLQDEPKTKANNAALLIKTLGSAEAPEVRAPPQ